jgi:TetR/AcrR family transcriptional regulator, cholesterol catabolism regulator
MVRVSREHVAGSKPAAVAPRPGSRRERRKLEVYRRIHRAAVTLFRRQGYEATTVEQIADRADVAKGTVFNYFPSKEALLHALSADIHDRLLEELGTADTWPGTCRDQVVRLLVALARLAQDDRIVFRLVLGRNLREFWRDAQQDPLSRHVQGSVRTALRRGRARGELDHQVRLESAARLIEAAFFTTMLDWLNGGIAEGAFRREVAGQLDIVFGGLARRA